MEAFKNGTFMQMTAFNEKTHQVLISEVATTAVTVLEIFEAS
jgi:hypothetical protein